MDTTRHMMGRARRNIRLARALRGGPVLPYVGWTGEGNLGDEAMYAAHQALLPTMRFAPLPTHPSRAAMVAATRLTRSPVRSICLGGGTLVGNGAFRLALARAETTWPGVSRFALGVGVEDPDYREGARAGVMEELDHWRQHLSTFAVLGVRGPRSRHALEQLGVASEVVGDPALALPPPPVASEPGLIGVNVGTVDDQWGGDLPAFHRRVVEFGRHAIAAGYRLRFVPTWDQDLPVQRRLAEELGPGATAPTHMPTLEQVVADLGGCDLVVAHKLHAAILAAVGGVPAIALEYRPKCRDFQESVGRGDFVVRTDRFDAGTLMELVAATQGDRDAQRRELARHVADLRARLARAADAATLSATGGKPDR